MKRTIVYRCVFAIGSIYGGYGIFLLSRRAGLDIPPRLALVSGSMILFVGASGVHLWWVRRQARSFLNKDRSNPAPKGSELSIDEWMRVPKETLDKAAETMENDTDWPDS